MTQGDASLLPWARFDDTLHLMDMNWVFQAQLGLSPHQIGQRVDVALNEAAFRCLGNDRLETFSHGKKCWLPTALSRQPSHRDFVFLDISAVLARERTQGSEQALAWMTRELHDQTSQELTALRLYTQVAQDQAAALPHCPAEHTRVLHEADTVLAGLIESFRDLCAWSYPADIKDNFEKSLTALVDQMRARCPELAIETDSPVVAPGDPNSQLAVFRIVQELLTNTVKHAQARRIHLRLWHDGDGYHLHYRDNGRGFDRHTVTPGIGTRSIEDRVAMLHATLMLKTAPGHGVDYLISLPPA